ncbi:MAG: PH domain-containing protein [Clostridiaceae bacterium]
MEEEIYQRINPSAKKVWIINGVISSIILFILALVVYHFSKHYVSFWPFVIAGMSSFLFIFIHPFIEYKQWSYKITEERVVYNHGIYYKKKSIIPISRIQHLDISQGPIQKIFKLSSVKIYTAGMAHEIVAISTSKAEEIVDNLNKFVLKVDDDGEI